MQVEVINEKRQMFNGETFYLCGPYFQHKGKRLHRTVWEFHNGVIPKGYHVHHRDENRANNTIENLELLKGHEHLKRHMEKEERKEKSKESIKKAIALAPEWHRSEEGRVWHREQGKESWRNRGLITYYCTWCNQPFQTKKVYSPNSNRFCCNNHKAAYRRKLVREGIISK